MRFAILALVALLTGQSPSRTPDIHFMPTRHNIADAMLRLASVTPGPDRRVTVDEAELLLWIVPKG